MKRCLSCQEDFSDKFSFCPVCGTTLNAIKAETIASIQSNFREESVASPSSIKPTVPASDFYSVETKNIEEVSSEKFEPEQTLSSNGHDVALSISNFERKEESMASLALTEDASANTDIEVYKSSVNDDDELHLTFLNDTGLTRRLFGELGGMAHEYQLTWPEFKKDPIGFIKRSFTAYKEAIGRVIGNRIVMAAMGAAVLAMGALVAVALLIDRSTSKTSSWVGIGLFSFAASILLLGIFASWLMRSNNEFQGAVRDKRQQVSESSSPWYLAAGIAAVMIPALLLGSYIAFEIMYCKWTGKCVDPTVAQKTEEEVTMVPETEIPKEEEKVEKGDAGNAKGKGGGSKAEYKKPQGGGGGGREEQKPASQGKLPQASLEAPQIIPPMPDPPRTKNPSLPTPTTIVADPTLFPPDPSNTAYGDPKSKSTDPSSGPGKNGGMGEGSNGGVGPGDGAGVGPGRGGNTGGGDRQDGGGGPGGGGGGDTDYNRNFKQSEVSQKAKITFNPQPEYTEEARKNQVQGVVRVQAVLTASGGVSNIRAIGGLPYGLTEKALAAARRIQFVPAKKDGRNVSQYVTLEYNFRIY